MKKIPLFFIFCILPVYAFSLSGETEKPAVSELPKESENTSTETDLSVGSILRKYGCRRCQQKNQ